MSAAKVTQKPVDDVFDYIDQCDAISISQLEGDKEISEVWVINQTSPSNIILLDLVRTGTSLSMAIKIPNTWIPTNLTNLVMKDMLTNSPDFRRLISKNFIKIISAEDAGVIMDSQEAVDEDNRLNDYINQRDKDTSRPNPVTVKKGTDEKDNAQPFVMDLLFKHESNDIKEAELITKLRVNAKSFTDADLQYIMANSVSKKAKDYAAKKLAA